MKIHFTKMSGAGNDFVVVDNRTGIITDRKQFSLAACHRRYGIGADGVLLVEKSDTAGFLMRYYNADGSDGGMCGNGGRCIAKFAHDIGVVPMNEFSFNALGYIYGARRIESDLFELKMKNPVDLKLNQTIDVNGLTVKASFIDTGAPHCVIFLNENPNLPSLDSVEVQRIGRSVRYHDLYQPKGTNVNFVSKTNSNSIQIRTYERGVEDETLACGTGSIASAIISSIKFGWEKSVGVKVQSGESLEVSFQKEAENFSNVRLKGSAKVTFEGDFDF